MFVEKSRNVSEISMDKSLKISEILKKRRKELSISYQDLAEKTGLSKSTLQRYETGYIKNIPVSKLEVLSEALGISAMDMIGLKEMASSEPLKVPVLGTVKAGYDSIANEELLGFEPAYGISSDIPHVWLKIKGDSMAPDIKNGDLALVRLQGDVDSGDIAVVFVDGEEGTIKKIDKQQGAISLIPINPEYKIKVFIGKETRRIIIYGKVVEIKRKY